MDTKLPSPEEFPVSKPTFVWLLNGEWFEFDTLDEAKAEMRDLWINKIKPAARHALFWVLRNGKWENVTQEGQ